MNKQDILKQAIFSHDIKAIRKLKSDEDIDFSIYLEEAISIGFEKNAHLNYFKIFFNKDECKDYFLNNNFHKEVVKKNRFDILDFLSSRIKLSFSFYDLFVNYIIDSSKKFKLFNKNEKKLLRGIASSIYYYSEDKKYHKELQNILIDTYDGLLNDNQDIERFLIFLDQFSICYKTRVQYINQNVEKILDFINTSNIQDKHLEEFFEVLSSNLNLEYINENLINKYKDNENILAFFYKHYNQLINKKLRFIKDKDNLENEIQFLIEKSELKGNFYTLKTSDIFQKACEFVSVISINKLIDHQNFNISIEDFVYNLERIKSKDFVELLLNKNLVCNQLLKESFIKSCEGGSWQPLIFSKESVFIYSFLNEKNEFTFEENYSILISLTKKSGEHEIFNYIFNKIIDQMNAEKIIELINTSSDYKYRDDEFDLHYPCLYLKFMLFNINVIEKLKDKKYQKLIKFPNNDIKRDFLNSINIYSF